MRRTERLKNIKWLNEIYLGLDIKISEYKEYNQYY